MFSLHDVHFEISYNVCILTCSDVPVPPGILSVNPWFCVEEVHVFACSPSLCNKNKRMLPDSLKIFAKYHLDWSARNLQTTASLCEVLVTIMRKHTDWIRCVLGV
jgi:hypothetical protein